MNKKVYASDINIIKAILEEKLNPTIIRAIKTDEKGDCEKVQCTMNVDFIPLDILNEIEFEIENTITDNLYAVFIKRSDIGFTVFIKHR